MEFLESFCISSFTRVNGTAGSVDNHIYSNGYGGFLVEGVDQQQIIHTVSTIFRDGLYVSQCSDINFCYFRSSNTFLAFTFTLTFAQLLAYFTKINNVIINITKTV